MVEYNCHKKEELKRLNEQIIKQDDMVERKPIELSNNYLYISGVSVVGIAGYLLYKTFKSVPPSSNISNVNTKIEPKRDILKCIRKFLSYIYMPFYLYYI